MLCLPFLFIYLFSLLFFIKKRALMGTKYYKIFIEHPLTYTIKGRKRNAAANFNVNFS